MSSEMATFINDFITNEIMLFENTPLLNEHFLKLIQFFHLILQLFHHWSHLITGCDRPVAWVSACDLHGCQFDPNFGWWSDTFITSHKIATVVRRSR